MASISLSASPASPDSAPLLIKKAAMRDIPGLLNLINSYAAAGIMLPRTELEMSENIRDFSVAYLGRQLVACGALHFYTPTSGEVRSLAVDAARKGHGIGRIIVQQLENEAIENGLHAIFAFTYVAEFFEKMGFQQVERGVLPLKVWKDCVRCSKFQCCDEIAMLKPLRPHPILSGDEMDNELIQLPSRKLA
jgi:amino-acid N-acetyltransferase